MLEITSVDQGTRGDTWQFRGRARKIEHYLAGASSRDLFAVDAELTAALLDRRGDAELWFAAGVCRRKRGALQSAAAAFEMCAWISGDSIARKFLEDCRADCQVDGISEYDSNLSS